MEQIVKLIASTAAKQTEDILETPSQPKLIKAIVVAAFMSEGYKTLLDIIELEEQPDYFLNGFASDISATVASDPEFYEATSVGFDATEAEKSNKMTAYRAHVEQSVLALYTVLKQIFKGASDNHSSEQTSAQTTCQSPENPTSPKSDP
jgi:hypothetical protein